MPRKVYDITTKLARRALPYRLEPYWRRLAPGEYVGYRQSQANPTGTWVARFRDEEGRQRYHALGGFDELHQAEKAAKEWIASAKLSGSVEPLTVALACKHYVAELRSQGKEAAAKEAETRFSRLVYGMPFAKIKMDALRADHVKQWRDSLTGLKAATVNRDLTTLRAAFNMAFKEGLVASDIAWRGVKKIQTPEGESTRRDRWLTADERKALMEAAHPALAALMRALLLTAARPGEIAACNVSHFDRKAGVLHLPNGKTGSRSIPLSTAMVDLCQAHCRDKLPTAPLFTDPDGRRWQRTIWSTWAREARRQAGLGDDVTLYVLRHTAISEMILGGIDAFTVARMAGTSTKMIDQHYGHLCAERTRSALDQVQL